MIHRLQYTHLKWILLHKVCFYFHAAMCLYAINLKFNIYFNSRIQQHNMILFLTHSPWSQIPSAMTSLCLSPTVWWDCEQRTVSERRVSHSLRRPCDSSQLTLFKMKVRLAACHAFTNNWKERKGVKERNEKPHVLLMLWVVNRITGNDRSNHRSFKRL